jgi:FKBP-type peptidyl-prolyl cis-trans isomerase
MISLKFLFRINHVAPHTPLTTRRCWLLVCVMGVIGFIPLSAQPKTAPDFLKDKRVKMSYAFGMSVVQGWQTDPKDFDPQWAVRGAKDAISSKAILTEKEMVEILTKFGREIAERHRQKRAPSTDNNVSVAEAWPKLKSNRFENEREQVSYALGVSAGPRLKLTAGIIDEEEFIQGLTDVLVGTARLTPGEMTAALAQLGQEVQSMQKHQREQLAEKNRKGGEAFLAENKTRPGIVCLPSGLQYKVIADGKGGTPELNNWVKLNYRGMRIDGTIIVESSKEHPEANIFGLGGVTQGWAEALQKMKVGAKWRLFIPSDLAFGTAGSPGIGPSETLVYDLELVSILQERPQPTAEDLKNEIGPDGD